MSEFSQKCRELLQENGTNVYRLSSSTSLERTTLQRMVTGKRLPGLDFVRQFCQALRISVPEKRQLLELYKIELVGSDTYHKRKLIRNLLEHLADTEEKQYVHTPDLQEFYPFSRLDTKAAFVQHQYNTELTLFAVMEQVFAVHQNGWIHTNIPASYEIFFHQIQILMQRYPKQAVEIQHIFNFRISASAAFDNLTVLCRILPMALSDQACYRPRYYFSNMQKTDFLQSLFPYYVITPDHVMSISGDFRTFVIHTDPSVLQLYQKEFGKLLQLSEPILNHYSTAQSAWEQYTRLTPPASSGVRVIEAQPCFCDMLTEDLFAELLEAHPAYAPLAADMPAFMADFSRREIEGVFSRKGLDTFWNTGILRGQAGAFLSPLTREQRRICLTNLLQRDQIHKRTMLTERIQIPMDLNFEIYGNHHLNIIRIDRDLHISLFVINESSICESFYDFAGCLRDPEYSCSEEDTDTYIRSLLS